MTSMHSITFVSAVVEYDPVTVCTVAGWGTDTLTRIGRRASTHLPFIFCTIWLIPGESFLNLEHMTPKIKIK